MQIEVKGRNCPVTDELRERTERRLAKVAKQVSDLARRSGLPLARALRRGGGASRQLGASREQRRAATRLEFRARIAAPERAVLVDDVHTTGATLHACAQALRRAGSRRIAVLTWARTLDVRPR